MEKKRIAVFDYKAEDCITTADAVRSYYSLEEQPVEVTEFTGFHPFVRDFDESRNAGVPYDMVFIGVDTMMGAEVARHIRAQDQWCPIFLVSDVSDFAMEGYRLCALDYFSKPATAEKVKNAVWRIGAKCLSAFQNPALFL